MSEQTIKIGDTVKITGMPDRGGVLDATSTKPGEPIGRVDDHWYLGTAIKRA